MKLDELELIQLFRQPGGKEFVRFCNEAIRVTCWTHGVPQSEVSTTLRTDIADGGVDTRVGRGIPDDPFGYFETPSIWQFKAADETNVGPADVTKEVNKPHAKKCTEDGDAYRLCICDHLTDEKKSSLQDALKNGIRSINALAPIPKVLSIDDITVVANSYAALVKNYRPELFGTCTLFDRWAETVTRTTVKFVPYGGFESTKAMILAHVDFASPLKDAVLPLHGQSGVGKTRTVYESLRRQPGVSSLVLYSDDEDGLEDLLTTLVNDATSRAVIVADECSLSTRVMLSRKLAGHGQHIRCISIDNSVERPASATPELEVRKPNQLELQKILETNFPGIPGDRLRAYAELSEGFVRIAVDMCCHYDDAIRQAGNISPIVGHINDYYRDRLGNEDRARALEAVALLKRVKRKGEAPTQLDKICELTHTDRHDVEQHLAAIKDAPGFVERGELYYRVTPEIIAMIAFEAAWKRWAEGRENEFLARVPEEIQEGFLRRVSEGRSVEVRNTVQKFFRRFADSFSARDLVDLDLVNRLIRLIETDPEQYLPRLREIVGSASHEELTRPPEYTRGSWGPRRQLVWLAEGFVQFAEFFPDCEDVLYRLARHESEPDIGNNATKTWQRLFRMELSGTSLPMSARLEVLRKRVTEASAGDGDLIAGALEKILDFHGSRTLGPAVLGGRIVPANWRPSPSEFPELLPICLRFIEQASRHPLESLARKAKATLLSDIEYLVRLRWIDQIKPIVAASGLDEHDRALLVGKLKRWAAWAKDANGVNFSDEYAQKLRAWVEELEPQTLRGRLVEAVGAQSIDYFGRENEWQSQLQPIASRFLIDEKALSAEIDWLTSPEARSSFQFGYSLGSIDSQCKYLDFILAHSAGRETGFARGYIAALIQVGRGDPSVVNEKLDVWEEKDPIFSFQIALAGGGPVRVFERTLQLINTGRLPAYHLRNFTHWVGTERTSIAQVLKALEILTPRAEQEEDLCSDVLMDFLGAQFHAGQLHELLSANANLVWNALVVFTDHPSRESFWWGQVLNKLAPDNPRLAVALGCKALVGESFEMKDTAINLLSNWAREYPEEVMAAVGAAMLDPATGVDFFISKFPLFTALPLSIVTAWLEGAGVEGARKIARHLPRPHFGADGQPAVPELTAWVLSRFEDDDRTFSEFCAGVHSFQVYMGDISGAHESEAQDARRFFNHDLRRIRQWARIEHASALQNAQFHREWEDEISP
ncbi:MAG: hypothetical protein WCA49_14945 [Candidatus Sulfotelmatobacter sp.]